MKRIGFAAVTVAFLLAAVPALPALAAGDLTSNAEMYDNSWHGEIMPYMWSTGIDGTLRVQNRSVTINKSFSDLWDYTNFGGSLYGAANKGHFTSYGQVDYFSLSKSDFSNAPPGADVGMKVWIYTLAGGYRFDASKGKRYDLMIGLRTASMDNSISAPGQGSYSNTRSTTDAVIIFRPFWPFSKQWAFSPTIDVGGGQSQLTYELWPQVRFQFAKHWMARLGYRQLYYRISNDNNNEWYGKFSGFTIGVGGTW